jgi:hypothetical protein
MENKYYLYRHIRLDKNEVFYVGIGTKCKPEAKTVKSEYGRAYQISGRSKYWRNVFNLTEIKVDIVLEHFDISFIKDKEKEFIKLYGRKDLNLGTLVNMTDGADGYYNFNSDIRPKGEADSRCVPIFIYKIDGTFVEERCGIKAMCRDYKFNGPKVWQQMNGQRIQYRGYRFFYEFQGEKIEPLTYYGSGCTGNPVIQLDNLGNIIKEFETLKNAAKYINVYENTMKNACKENKLLNNYYWQYKNII